MLLNHGQAIATSSNDNQQMFLSVEFMPSSQAITQLLPSADIVSQQEGSLEIKIKDNADLKQQLLALSQAGPLIKNLHFSQNSIDHLHFNSYRGQ